MSKVLVVDAEYETISSALDRVFQVFPIDVRGKSVLLKPNMLGPFSPETHVNTAPPLIRALVKRLQADGGQVTVADNPGMRGYGAVEKSGKNSGITEASLGTFSSMSAEVETLALPGNDMTVNISKKVLEADILISAPKFKTHILTTISGAIKNSFGFVVGGDKRRLHRDFPDSRAFSRMLVDVYRIRIPDLVIMDGVVGMQGNGPTSKQLYPVGKILASDNGVSLDGVMASMMGARPEKVAMLSYANQLALGEIDTSRIDIDGDAGGLKKFRRPMTAITRLIPGTLIQTFLPGLDHPRFEVDAGLCNTCCQCADICPGKAIAIEDSLPRYDYSECISCYCCMELCPQQAIECQENVLFRLYRKLGIFH